MGGYTFIPRVVLTYLHSVPYMCLGGLCLGVRVEELSVNSKNNPENANIAYARALVHFLCFCTGEPTTECL